VAEPDPANYPWWLASRSAGIVAFVLIAASVTLGLFMASGVYRRPGLKRDLLKVHQHLALAGLTMIGLHGVLLLGDKWLKPGIAGIAVPFAISYRPVWVGLGICGGYLAALLGPTYFVRRRTIGTRRWRRIHQATVVVYVLAVLHSLGAGTDGAATWFTVLVLASAVPIAVLLALRYRPRLRARPGGGRRTEPLRPVPRASGGR
jgi:methionine sulfoxide reductase heme-binding subunit